MNVSDELAVLATTGEMIAIGASVGLLAFALGLYSAFRFKNRPRGQD